MEAHIFAAHIEPRTPRFQEATMKTRVGERYQCSDPDCGCEIEITTPSRMSAESSMNSPMSSSMREFDDDRSIGGSATGETGPGTLRNAESSGISTPGDFGSQGATGEGVFGTSGGNQRSTMSGRLGSTTGGLKSSATGSPAATPGNRDDMRNDMSMSDMNDEEDEGFSCCCGQLMRKSSNQSRAARA
jgi:hypothetical protein